MKKYTILIIIGIFGVLLFVVAFNAVKRNFRPLAMTADEIKTQVTENAIGVEIVIATMNDNLYHVPGCPHASGPCEKIAFSLARERGLEPCPYCYVEEE